MAGIQGDAALGTGGGSGTVEGTVDHRDAEFGDFFLFHAARSSGNGGCHRPERARAVAAATRYRGGEDRRVGVQALGPGRVHPCGRKPVEPAGVALQCAASNSSSEGEVGAYRWIRRKGRAAAPAMDKGISRPTACLFLLAY